MQKIPMMSERQVFVDVSILFAEEDDQRKIVEITEEHILGYAMQGLRTLCMAKKVRNFTSGIRKTCSCNAYPLNPHFYKVKLEYTGIYNLLTLDPKYTSTLWMRFGTASPIFSCQINA